MNSGHFPEKAEHPGGVALSKVKELMGQGIVAWGTYIPYFRLERKAIELSLPPLHEKTRGRCTD